MKNISEILENLITECECDNRISTGIFDVYNTDHLVVLSEHMQKYGISESTIESAIESMALGEGKYPERQAFNKDGWLVTFPSKEYRDAALKKGTHSVSDPTHGKGGMNLYYKKKGKQKRQKMQTQTAVDTPAGATPPPANAQSLDITKSPASKDGGQPSTTGEKPAVGSTEDQEESDYVVRRSAELKKKAADIDKKYKAQSSATSQEAPETPKPAEMPAVEVPVVTTPPEQYASISKQFAQKKGWMAEPYGEYRDRDGNTVAVVGLSGEVVPTKSVDRDEYKLFAEKNMV
jgi:hypothetical protein